MLFLSFVIMVMMAWASTFMDKTVEQFIFEGFMWIVLGGLFSVASEQFGQKFNQKLPEESQNKEN